MHMLQTETVQSNHRTPQMYTLPDEIWPLVIDRDWRVYAGLLAVPKFARLAMRDPIKWRRLLTVENKEGRLTVWRLAGCVHREDDLPAIIREDGHKQWHQYGEVHRDGDLPAVIASNGRQSWYQHDQLHRDGDQPAVLYPNGEKHWYHRGKYHRDGDHPAVIYKNGGQEWYRHGVLVKISHKN